MICLSIAAATNAEALRMIRKASSLADVAELRLDAIPGADLAALMQAGRGPLLVTCRSKKEGGRFEGTEAQRVNHLKEAVRRGAAFVDVELSTDPRLIGELLETIARERGAAKLILSHHDVESTPPLRSLTRTLEACRTFRPEVVKIVTFARRAEDNLRVLGLIPRARRENQKVIAFCMGEFGRMSRVAAPFLGSFMTFASPGRSNPSAPGQLTLQEARAVVNMMRGGPTGGPEGER